MRFTIRFGRDDVRAYDPSHEIDANAGEAFLHNSLLILERQTLRFKRKESHHGYSPGASRTVVDRLWAFPIQLCHVRSVYLEHFETRRD